MQGKHPPAGKPLLLTAPGDDVGIKQLSVYQNSVVIDSLRSGGYSYLCRGMLVVNLIAAVWTEGTAMFENHTKGVIICLPGHCGVLTDVCVHHVYAGLRVDVQRGRACYFELDIHRLFFIATGWQR